MPATAPWAPLGRYQVPEGGKNGGKSQNTRCALFRNRRRHLISEYGQKGPKSASRCAKCSYCASRRKRKTREKGGPRLSTGGRAPAGPVRPDSPATPTPGRVAHQLARPSPTYGRRHAFGSHVPAPLGCAQHAPRCMIGALPRVMPPCVGWRPFPDRKMRQRDRRARTRRGPRAGVCSAGGFGVPIDGLTSATSENEIVKKI